MATIAMDPAGMDQNIDYLINGFYGNGCYEMDP